MRIINAEQCENLFAKDKIMQVRSGDENTVDGSRLNLLQKGDADALREKGNKKAVRQLVEQLQRDVDAQMELKERQSRQKQLASENKKCMECIKEQKAAEEAILETGSVTIDDISAGDISLMMQSIERPDTLTKADKEKLASFSADKETVVRNEAVSLIKSRDIQRNNERKKAIGYSIDDTKVELEKKHGMVDAKKEAEYILESIEENIVSDLRKSGMEKIEERRKEEEEKAEKAEKQQREVEQPSERDALQIQELQQQVQRQELLQNKVLKMKEEECLLDDDLLGLTVDDVI